MPTFISGSTGISGTDGTAATPAVQGATANTGVFFPAANTVAWATGGVERMRVAANGNIGIGTTAPNFSGYGTTNLTVSGGTTIQGVLELVGTRVDGDQFAAGDINFFADSNSAGNKRIVAVQAVTDGATTNNRGGALLFNTKANNGSLLERMRITSSGDLLLGVTARTSPVGMSGANFQVTTGLSVFNGTNYVSYSVDRINFNIANYYVLNQNSVGVVLTNGGTSWSAQSDERLKDVIEPIGNAAEKVASLRPVIGRYKTDEQTKRRAFLIAQDVQRVLPEAVSEDDQGNLLLAYTELVPLLTAALQEALKEIDGLKARIESLESK